MGAKVMLAAMLLGTPTVMVLGARPESAPPVAEKPRTYTEKPWLTREAAAELVAPGGRPGTLFAGVILGGSEPPAPIRERIAAFATQHGIDIELEMNEGNVTAIRATVIYDGGFGYEGADMLGLRFERPAYGGCGSGHTWINDWSLALGSGVYARVSIRVNRVEIVWGPTLPVDEVLARAESLLGKSASELRRSLGDRFHATDTYSASVEIPLDLVSFPDENSERAYVLSGHHRTRIHIVEGRAAMVLLDLDNFTSEAEANTRRALDARWGRPRVLQPNDVSVRLRRSFAVVGDEGGVMIMTRDDYRYWLEQATAQ